MTDLKAMGEAALAVKPLLQRISTEEKNCVLNRAADVLIQNTETILAENERDMENARKNGMNPGMQDRLKLTANRIAAMAEGLKEIALLPDCVGETMEEFERPNGLKIKKVRVPIGVIGIIYEARPNVTADAFGLCFKTGNAVILKGGSDALYSNLAIVKAIREALEACGVPGEAVQLIADTDRAVTVEFMKMKEYVDVLIPRGSGRLIASVVENSTIPVIETGTGNCHVYVDKAADLDMAVKIIYNAKTQRIGVCNACESLVIHRDVREAFLPKLAETLAEKSVEMRGDERVREILPDCVPATEEDYKTEYLDYILSLKTVDSIEEAIAHINKYNTRHSECIVTEDAQAAEKFLNEVDAACVYWNASTRFTDGFEFGFGAEIGISTQKLHARGPMGLKELTSYKYTICGKGQVRP
ncbi:MAG: glutamate-5-semialdehyde dehydrogenase [Acetatifactor sp.]